MLQCHRHIVAVPPVLLLLMISLWGVGYDTDLRGDVRPDKVIFGGEGLEHTSIGESVLTSWSGFFFAKESDGNLSVAALSSPVSIKTTSGTVLVPIGWQWRTDGDLSRIPRHFLERSLKEIVTYSSVTVPGAFATPDSWLVASLHPLMADQVWVMEDPEGVSDADHMSRLMRFPQSDTLPDAFAPFTVERWGIEVREFLEGAEDPSLFLNQLVPHVAGMIRWFMEQGYPERSARYREAIENTAGGFRMFLSEESKMVLEELRSDEEPVLDDHAVEQPIEPLEPTSSIPFDPDTIKQQAYVMLRDMGALFTINTEIVPISFTSAEVHAVVFGDHVFDFVLDTDQKVLDGMSMDGKVMAYPISIEEFKRWLKGVSEHE
ncbi:hypothetical protein HYZ98_00455 [Candidatus Peregrinibacteria bacterium]|nr:hypothetical protein [Candidatus Peregrinibacteria bacterium]